jgi:soluble lytic murein transglycosylase
LSRRAVAITVASAVVLVALIVFGLVLSRQRVQRHAVFRHPTSVKPEKAPPGVPPVEQWSETFRHLAFAGQWDDLGDLLEQIEKRAPDLYARNALGYLHARARIETNDLSEAERRLAPFLAPGNPYRDLALFHQAEIDDARDEPAKASQSRNALIAGYPQSVHRDEAIDDEIEYRSRIGDAGTLAAMEAKLPAQRRDLEAHVAELLLHRNQADGVAKAIAILRGNTLDDPADRAARALDTPAFVRRLAPDQLILLGTAMQNHRHFDRAVALLSLVPPSDDVLFAIGRSWFGDEKYAQAQQTYLRGANATRDPKQKVAFLWHASRAAQLTGNDALAEQLMTQALAMPVRVPATLAALTQRIRTRLRQHRVAEGAADLQTLRKIAPKDHALAEGSLAYAIGMVAMNQPRAAVATLNSVPPVLLDKFDRPEFDYWRGRALESVDAHAAFEAYLRVLRATVPTHFAYFARDRLRTPAMQQRLAAELAARDAQVRQLVAAKNFVQAKSVATDRVLLSFGDRTKALQTLASIYANLPPYRAIVQLAPERYPLFPLQATDRGSQLMAMGLYDEATDAIVRRWPLRPAQSALTQSLALNRGSASKLSIFAIEILMNGVPDDFVPDLLPLTVRELLYPRYFWDFIEADAKKYEADPTLVLSIMREESRFNPRAKSEAAARGLLQFIITTARQIGRDVGLVDVSADDLYDPRVIIRLGAKYIATLTKQFNGDRYAAVAAYNAGPHQVALWLRLAPATGDDYFISAINFDETKNYVRKVMNSYRRYSEIYGGAGAQGGVRMEP